MKSKSMSNNQALIITLSSLIFYMVGTISIHYIAMVSHAHQLGSPVTSNTPTNPFGEVYEGPPQIVMIHNNTEYAGALDSYSFSTAKSIGGIPVFNDAINSTIPNQTVTVEKDSVLRFAIKGNAPPEAQSDSLAVNAYTINGNPVKVLEVAKESQKTTFVVDLPEGTEYILMAIATWFPQENAERITGYVSYSYRLTVLR